MPNPSTLHPGSSVTRATPSHIPNGDLRRAPHPRPVAVAPLAAQSITFGALSGQVTDAAGRPIADAEVRLTDPASGAERTTVTTRDGRFRFGLLGVAGTMSGRGDRLSARGHSWGVHVASGAAVSVRFTLRPAAPPVVTGTPSRRVPRRPRRSRGSSSEGYADITGSRRTIGDVATLSPFADADGIEGLPWRFAEVVVDGSRIGGVANPATSGAETVGLAMPTRGLALATAGGVGFDVEMSGSGVGLVGTTARAGPVGIVAVPRRGRDVGASAPPLPSAAPCSATRRMRSRARTTSAARS
jgi:hypothetical protein